jgi:hypothetical protein
MFVGYRKKIGSFACYFVFEGWNRCSLNQLEAKAILAAALEVLAVYDGCSR